MMKWFVRDPGSAARGWRADVTENGLLYSQVPSSVSLSSPIVESVLVQWSDAGHAIEQDGGWLVPWRSIYELLTDQGNPEVLEAVGVPTASDLAPHLVSRGSLTEKEFTIAIAGWIDGSGRTVQGVAIRGATACFNSRTLLLSHAAWNLTQRVAAFAQRPESDRSERNQRLAWSEIRALALAAGARLDNFLFSTIVLSPDRLKVGLRQSGDGRSRVIEVAPGFEGCPEEWVSSFDAHSTVRDRYDLPTREGVVQVIVKPEVKTVLEQIKRLPGRRVAGARAEAFITNPFAALGEAANEVIDPAEFEAERERAGLCFDRFTANVLRDESGAPIDIGLLIESGVGPGSRSARQSMTVDQVSAFVREVRESLAAGRQLHAWQEFEFELLGNVEQELEQLAGAAAASKPDSGSKLTRGITLETIYDLSGYSQRIQGIGEEKPYVLPILPARTRRRDGFPTTSSTSLNFPRNGPVRNLGTSR